jgi:ribosome-associated toxin RatA of RatAB toxin-antitoxin module
MRHFIPKIFLLVAFIAAPALLPEVAWAQSASARIAKIEKSGGFMVWNAENDTRSKVKWGVVDALLPVSAEELKALLRNYNGYKNFLEFFTTTKVLETKDGKSIVRLKANIAGGAVKLKAKATMTETKNSRGDTHFKLRYIRGNVKRLDGDWIVTEVSPKQTLLKMRLLVDPDLWMTSNSTLSEYNLVNSRRTLRAIKKILAKR